MKSLLLSLLLLGPLLAQADGRLFYQPLNVDAALSQEQWREIWRDTADKGVKTLVVQWTRFGDEAFGGAQGWLANSLREAQGQGLKLILGLHYDPQFYQQLAEHPDFAQYWQQQLALSLEQRQRLEQEWQIPVTGWYLPMELDDWNFRDMARREVLQQQLIGFAAQLGRPLHLSAFSGGFLPPNTYAGWLDSLVRVGLTLWWQDGVGTGALTPLVRLAYVSALPCKVGIIREAFRQVSAEGEPFMAVPGSPSTWPPCHATAVFELRYRPWARTLYDIHYGLQSPSPLLR